MAVNNEYVNRVDANGQTLIDLTSDTAEAADVLEGRTLHLASGAPATGTYRPSDEIEARLEATVGHSSKNLFKITAETDTNRGVTFTVDKQAGTVTTTGTATGGSAIFYMPISADVKGDFYYSGCAEGGTSSTYYIDTYDEDTGVKLKSWDGTTPTSNCYYLTQSRKVQIPQGHNNCSLRIVIARNVNANGFVFKPMIRDPRIADDEPEPYVQPTDERIGEEIEARLKATVGHSSKNLLDISGQDSINYGVRWYEENGRLRAVGTYNDNAAHSQPRFYTKLKAGSYIFSGSPIYSETGVRILIGTCLDAQGTSFTALGYDEGNGFTFTLQSDSWVSIRIYTAKDLYQQSIDLTLPVMLHDGSIADDTFEPYVQPTDDRITALEARVAALEAIINNS